MKRPSQFFLPPFFLKKAERKKNVKAINRRDLGEDKQRGLWTRSWNDAKNTHGIASFIFSFFSSPPFFILHRVELETRKPRPLQGRWRQMRLLQSSTFHLRNIQHAHFHVTFKFQITGNEIGPAGARALSKGLKENASITDVNLYRTNTLFLFRKLPDTLEWLFFFFFFPSE